MRVAQINATCGIGGTGKIATAVSDLLDQHGIENYIFYSCGTNNHKNGIKYTSWFSVKYHAFLSRVLGNYGFENKSATRSLLKHLKKIQPDIIHLHNIHSHDCHLQMLFDYIRKNHIKVYWTFHDCWSFTGYCPYFDAVGCSQWLEECKKCPQRKKYSWFFDRSRVNFQKKSKLLDGVDATIITPSKWLADLVQLSCFNTYPVRVINNGIDLSVFCPRTSDFRKNYNCENKFVVLGVAFGWEERKGLDVFLKLAEMLDERYQIVLVGAARNADQKLPDNVISIPKVHNQEYLAQIYSAADIFVNPTREENYPTVNMEALACGTPVLTFRTGGSGEMVDETCGSVVQKNDIQQLYKEIIRICEEKPFSHDICITKAKQFDIHNKYRKYIDLYKENEFAL